jgi:hypothetical protein
MNTNQTLTAAQRNFLTQAADNTGMRMVFQREKRTLAILEAAGLVKMGRGWTAYLTRKGYAAIDRAEEF